MLGGFVSIDTIDIRLPAAIVLDSNVIIHRFLVSRRYNAVLQARAYHAFDLIERSQCTALVPPRGISELLHETIRLGYERDLDIARLAARSSREVPRSWTVLQKQNPGRIEAFVSGFSDLVEECERRGVVGISPDELDPLLNTKFARYLASFSERYSLDSTDAELLMEAARFGVRDILTLDRDYHRATADFTIYGWPAYNPGP